VPSAIFKDLNDRVSYCCLARNKRCVYRNLHATTSYRSAKGGLSSVTIRQERLGAKHSIGPWQWPRKSVPLTPQTKDIPNWSHAIDVGQLCRRRLRAACAVSCASKKHVNVGISSRSLALSAQSSAQQGRSVTGSLLEGDADNVALWRFVTRALATSLFST